MTLNKSLFLVLTLSFNSCLFGQDDLDEIFEDPSRKLSLNVGTSVSSTLSGILNLEADVCLFDQFFMAHVGAGIIPFKYRFNITEGYQLMTDVGFGTMTQASLGFRMFKWDNWGSADMYIGPKVEFINHLYSNLEALDKNGDFGEFHVSGNDKMVYKRREQNYGIILHVVYGITPHISMTVGASLGFGNVSCKYDPENSSGIEWISSPPTGWTKGVFSNDAYFRFNFSIKYRIF